MQEVARGVYEWSHFSEEKQLDFNGHLVTSGRELVIIDPPPMSEADAAFVERQGRVVAIVLTNRDHVREAGRYRTLFRTKVLAPAQDAPLMDITVDGLYTHGNRLLGVLQVIQLADNKTPGESALLLERDAGVLILGDALIGKPPGALSLLPPDKYADVDRAKAGVGVPLGHASDTVLVGDGRSILVGGKDALRRAVAGV
jgi:hypothetical protein